MVFGHIRFNVHKSEPRVIIICANFVMIVINYSRIFPIQRHKNIARYVHSMRKRIANIARALHFQWVLVLRQSFKKRYAPIQNIFKFSHYVSTYLLLHSFLFIQCLFFGTAIYFLFSLSLFRFADVNFAAVFMGCCPNNRK